MKELTRREREQLEREDAIVTKAEELFCKYGFEKTSMDVLAKESEFTKRTLYRYFTSKEDLFFAVAVKGRSRLLEIIRDRSMKGKTGFEKIRLSYYAYYEYYCKYPQLLQLSNMVGAVKPASPGIDMPHRREFMDMDKELFQDLMKVFQEGKSDGSIRPDLETSLLALSSIFVATGFFQLLSMSGQTYTAHFGLNRDEFEKFTLEMLIGNLQKN